jgi:hypothetical protein
MTGPLYDILPPAEVSDVSSDEPFGRFLDYVAGKGLDSTRRRRRRSSSGPKERTSS